MKPGKHDRKHEMLITGNELVELKRLTHLMAEAYDLDKKIDQYQGTRPLTLYRWDIECLLDAISGALDDPQDYPNHNDPSYAALNNLHERLKKEYEATYGDELS